MEDFTIRDFDALIQKVEAASLHPEDIAGGLMQVLLYTSGVAKNLCDVGSGETRNSIREEIDMSGSEIRGYVYCNAEQAPFIEFGTGPVGEASGGNGSDAKITYGRGPWKIKRRGGKEVLADYWVYRNEKGEFFATRGQPARPFLYPASQQGRRRAASIMRKYLQKKAGGE